MSYNLLIHGEYSVINHLLSFYYFAGTSKCMLVLYVPLGCNSTYKQPYSLEVPQATQYQTPILILGGNEIDQATNCKTWLLMEEIWLTRWYCKYPSIYRVYNPTWLGIVEISPVVIPSDLRDYVVFHSLRLPNPPNIHNRSDKSPHPSLQRGGRLHRAQPKITYHSWETKIATPKSKDRLHQK